MSYAHAAQLALLAAVLAGPARAQTTSNSSWPTYEGFAGFSASGIINASHFKAVSVSDIAPLSTNRAGGPDGFNVSIARYFNRHVGLKADFSTYLTRNDGGGTFDSSSQPFTLRSHAYNLLFGPEFKLRNRSRATPFVHLLGGVAHATTDFKTDSAAFAFSDQYSRTGAALAMGGGVDLRLVQHVSLRLAADYEPSFLTGVSPSGVKLATRQNNFRMTIGVAIH